MKTIDIDGLLIEKGNAEQRVERIVKERDNLRAELNCKNTEWTKIFAELSTKLATVEIERDEARAATDFANLACEKLEAKLATVEAQLKQRGEIISGLQHETEMWDEFMSPFTEYEGDEAPWITMKGEFESLLARLEEARWLLDGCGGQVNSWDWNRRRGAWLSGHTPTERVGKEAK